MGVVVYPEIAGMGLPFTGSVIYSGAFASAPTPTAAMVGKVVYLSDKPTAQGGAFTVRESSGTPGTYIYDRIGGGPVVADTWENIITNYVPDAAGFAKYKDCRFRVTNVGYNGSDWQSNGTELFPLAPITLFTSTASYARAPSGTINTGSSGNITFGTAANRAYTEGIFVYLPSIATMPAITAGYYWCVMSNTTTGTLYATSWSGSTPTIGAAINFTGGASYTGVTTTVNTPAFTVLGGLMGNYRTIKIDGNYSTTNNANSKSTAVSFNGTVFGGNSSQNITSAYYDCGITNRNGTLQFANGNIHGGGSGSQPVFTVNTASSFTLTMNLFSGSTATDWWIIDTMNVVLFPR